MSIYLQNETNRIPWQQFSWFLPFFSQQSEMSQLCIHLHSSEDVSTMSESELCSIIQNTWPPHIRTWPYGSLQNQTIKITMCTLFISWQEHRQLPWFCLMFWWFETATYLLILVFCTSWTSSLECFPAVYSVLSGFLK